MTKLEYTKCEKLMNEAIRNAENANESWKKYERYKKENNMVEAEIGMREFDYHRGYAEGINQALAVIGFKHKRMTELLELLD